MSHSHTDMLPKGALITAGALVAFALAITSFMRIAGVAPSASPAALRAQQADTVVHSRDLRFSDRADGAVVITDVGTGQIASVIPPGQETGFVRAVMRGLARERHMHGIGAEPPFNLTLWNHGQLSLTDSATGRSIELGAFGSTNRAEFAALLPKAGRSR